MEHKSPRRSSLPFGEGAGGGEYQNKTGVTDRTRTGDNQNHNLGLYQLSYGHRWGREPTDFVT